MNLMNKPPMGQKQPRVKRYSAEERKYFRWLHSFGMCCLSGRPDIEIAHTGGLAEGKGTGLKALVQTSLPLARALHHFEERNRADFWERAGFPDHIAWAQRLFDIWEKGGDRYEAEALLRDMQDRASRAFLAEILSKES
ncbi:hypothetical protein [Celeribacter naphthalenivorans]|uniref:hypothetical protein n=1 Tax=Celeribacter naphthalenivorans TaxID=1614694 RepID=UPI001CFA3FDB|nr:hypothetical protein [Celeribacter naphthalenivorans]